MATYYSQKDGVWSDMTVWKDGPSSGSSPANLAAMDDSPIVIQAGHDIELDVDTSGFANGIAGLTITSDATTPGMLFSKYSGAGTYHLKIKAATNIVGTNAAVFGRILANSDGVWANSTALPNDRKFIIEFAGATAGKITAQYLDLKLYCLQPTNTSVEVWGTVYTVTGEADDDKITFTAVPSATPVLAGTPVYLSGTLPDPLVAGTVYYARTVAGATTTLTTTFGGGADINLTTDGSGTIYLHYGKWTAAQATDVNTTTGVVTWNGTAPADGTPIMIKSSGTLPTGWTATDVYYTRAKSTNTCKLALTNEDATIKIPSGVGSGTLTMYCGNGAAAYATAAVNVIQNVTADSPWSTTDGIDRVVLTDANAPGDYDQQRLQLTTIAANYLVLSANLDSQQYPLARLFLSSRNVSIRSASTSGSQPIVDFASQTTAVVNVLQCEINNTAGTGTTFYGNGVNAGTGHTISGTVSGCTLGVNSGAGHTISGTVIGCNYGFNYGTGHTISGTVSGCTYSVYVCTSHTISGMVSGCTYGVYSSSVTMSGTITGCTYTFRSWLSVIVKNGGDIGAVPTWYDRNTNGQPQRVACENFNGVLNAHKIFDAFGDIVKTACDGTGDAPSVDPDAGNGDCIEASSLQSNLSAANKLLIFDKHRLWMTAAAHTVTYKVQTTFSAAGGIAAGGIKLTATYMGTDDAPTEVTHAPAIATRDNDADWAKTLAVTFTPNSAGWVDFKMELFEYEANNEVYVWPVPVIT